MSTLATNAITDASGGNTATINSYTPTESNMAGRNRIINGDMKIAQRGTSVTGFTSGQLRTCDRIGAYVNACTWTGIQDTDAPTGFSNSVRITCTTANASIGAADQVQYFYNIEDRDLQDLAKGTADSKSFTVSFWIKSNKTGTSVLNINDGTNSRHVNKTYTINSANTWEYKTITFPGDTSGVLTNNNSSGLLLEFWFRVGSNNSSGSIQNNWTSFSAVNRAAGTDINLGTAVSDYVAITGLQFEIGETATPFERRPYGTELALCQRYYTKTYPVDVAPGTNTGTSIAIGRSTDATSSYTTIAQWAYPVTMRATPSISLFNPVTGTVNSFRGDGSNYSPSQTIFISTCAVTASVGNVSIGTSTYVSTHIVASSEL
jgi:hypothetical protein